MKPRSSPGCRAIAHDTPPPYVRLGRPSICPARGNRKFRNRIPHNHRCNASMLGLQRAVNDQHVAICDAGIDHRLPRDADHEGGLGVDDLLCSEVDSCGGKVFGRAWSTGAYAVIYKRDQAGRTRGGQGLIVDWEKRPVQSLYGCTVLVWLQALRRKTSRTGSATRRSGPKPWTGVRGCVDGGPTPRHKKACRKQAFL